MDLSLLQKSDWYSIKKIFLLKKRISNIGCFHPQNGLFLKRNSNKGFIELEMLLWTLVITALLGGFFRIHQTYMKQHQKLQKDFQDEWNNI